MTQSISLITLGITDLMRSRRFYSQGFGWQPVFENPEIIFYQMNGIVLGTWVKAALDADTGRASHMPGAFALGHNLATQQAVEPLMARLVTAGGVLLKAAKAPPHGGFSGYVADPDGHAWEIAWNPAWRIGPDGGVSFGI